MIKKKWKEAGCEEGEPYLQRNKDKNYIYVTSQKPCKQGESGVKYLKR